jgi:hypothetical protein
MPFFLGARRISQLAIDGDKDFSGRAILNVRLSGTVSGSPVWMEAQAFPPPLMAGNLVLRDTGLTLPRAFTFPDLADTVVTLAAPQTLSNKTLSAPALSGTVTGVYTLGGSPTLASDLALSGPRTVGGTLTVDPVSRNVGIGTTAPGYKLDIFTGGVNTNLFRVGDGAYNRIVVGNSIDLRAYPARGTSVSISGMTGSGSFHNMVRVINDQVGGNPVVALAESVGNVGIRTTTPEFRLDVAGSVAVRGDILPNADNQGNIGLDDRRWARVRSVLVVAGDYVFENGWRFTERGDGIALLRPDGSVAAVWN